MTILGETSMFTTKVKSEVIKNLIDVTSPLVNEAKFSITKDGISLRAVDPAHVAMVSLTLNKEAFDEYKADEMEIGIDLDKLASIMRLASSGDMLALDHDTAKNQLVITIGNLTRRMALIDTAGMPDSKVPNLELPAKVVVKAGEISRGVKASESISDHLCLRIEKDLFNLSAEGDTDTVDLKLGKESLETIETSDSYKSMFSIDYFYNMIKPVKPSDPLTISLGNDNPVRLDFSIASENGSVTYLLAPRIETD